MYSEYSDYSGSKFDPQNKISLTLIQIPQPIQRVSEIHAILLWGVTSMHNFPGKRKIEFGYFPGHSKFS